MKDEQTEALKRFNDEQAKIVAEYVQKSNIAELERLKKEIEKIPYYQLRFEVPRRINRRISELKGE